MRRVVFNQKGGVGKSTIVCNLAAIAAANGRQTLVGDLDTQANTTQPLLGERLDQSTTGIAEFFAQMLSYRLFSDEIDDFVHPTQFANLQLLAASPQLDDSKASWKAVTKCSSYARRSPRWSSLTRSTSILRPR